jgi:hypothetical protein
MIRTLLIIAAASLVACVLSIGGFLAVGGVDAIRNGEFEFGPRHWRTDSRHDHDGRQDRMRDAGPTISRTLVWNGTDRLQVDLDADIAFSQSPTASVTLSGPRDLVDQVRLENGRLRMADGGTPFHFDHDGRDLRITISAPGVRQFALNGSARLEVADYDQPNLALSIAGSGEVQVRGKTQSAALDIAGSGEADLEDLTLAVARVSVAGSGDARLAPTDSADVKIAGSGDVTLQKRPPVLSSNISGSGDLIFED